ncbi:hypothetical protein CIRG_02674 [Coccidioides immitis RMSCC 2394]|nr:hypothetical protein CIRG_02674 [Coccidioides immitis RMSCC 2394]
MGWRLMPIAPKYRSGYGIAYPRSPHFSRVYSVQYSIDSKGMQRDREEKGGRGVFVSIRVSWEGVLRRSGSHQWGMSTSLDSSGRARPGIGFSRRQNFSGCNMTTERVLLVARTPLPCARKRLPLSLSGEVCSSIGLTLWCGLKVGKDDRVQARKKLDATDIIAFSHSGNGRSNRVLCTPYRMLYEFNVSQYMVGGAGRKDKEYIFLPVVIFNRISSVKTSEPVTM